MTEEEYRLTYREDIGTRAALGVLAVFMALRLLLGVAYAAANPLGEAPDEADHYAYAAYLGREHRMPDGAWMTQAKHPPLYHVLAGAVAGWTGMDFTFLRSNPDVGVTPDAAAPNFFVHTALENWPWQGGALAMHLGRIVSVLAGVGLVAATYALGCAIWPGRRSIALAAAAFVAFLPESLFIGASMSNDMLAALFSTLALWLALYRPEPRFAVFAGLCLGLAFLTKVSTVSLAPVIAAAMLAPAFALLPQPTTGRRQVKVQLKALRHNAGRVLLVAVSSLIFAAPWLWRNWRLYGDPTGMPLVLATIDQRQGPLDLAALITLLRGWSFSFWGKFGGAGHLALPWPFYAAWFALLLLAAAGWVRYAAMARTASPGSVRQLATKWSGWIVLLGSPTLVMLSIVSYSRIALGTDQGRLLFPALAPIALLVAGGLATWMPRLHPRALVLGMSGVMALAGVLALLASIVTSFAPPPPPEPAVVAQAAPIGQVFGDELELLAGDWHKAEGDAELTLYWRAARPPKEDLRTSLRLVDAQGNLVWEWKRSPGAGRFSTDRWPAGRTVADVYRVPIDALERSTHAELAVNAFENGRTLQPHGQPDPAITLPIPGAGQ